MNDKATIFNKEIDLIFSSSGHYCVNIVPESCENVLILKFEPSTENKYRQVKKIHTQFGHASKDDMFKILQNTNLLNGNIKPIVERVVNLCETCIKFRKLLPQPIVAFLKADDFKETVTYISYNWACDTCTWKMNSRNLVLLLLLQTKFIVQISL